MISRMFPQSSFALLPYRFMVQAWLTYIVLELLASSALQYIDGLADMQQGVFIALRLTEFMIFGGLIFKYKLVESLGLQTPNARAIRLFIYIATGCVAIVAVLYAVQPSWFLYIQIPVWLQGLQGLLLMVMLAPVVEELFFRGLFYRMLRERWNVLISTAVSAVFFSLLHHGLIVSPQLAGGIIFALAYEMSRSLWVAIALHMGANAAVYVLSVWM